MDDVGLQFGLIEEVAAVNPDSSRTRQERRDLHRAIRCGKRDDAQ